MKTTEAVTSGVSSSRLTGWRPAWEGWSAAAGFAAAGTTAAMVPGWWGAGLASVLALMGVVRTAEALRTASRRIPLAGFAPAFIHAGDLIRILREKGMDEKKAVDFARKTARERLVARYEAGRIALLDSMRFNAGREGRLVKNLWIGRGFEWTPAHAQALYELAATPVKPVIVPKRIRKALSLPDPLGAGDIGSPIIHGIGATEEDDIVRPLSSLGGGTLIVGTTQAGKGVMLTSLVTQAILRGEPVIVIDPKSSKRLRNAVWKAAEIAGRPAPLEFHPAFPEMGVRLDPLGAWTRPTELATRIAAVMPPDSGAFGNFAWMAVNVAVEGLFYVTERPSLLGLRRLLEGGIDPLLKKALARSFRDAGIDDWEEQVERMDKRNICPPAANAGIELTAAVALWEETVGKKDEGDANAVVGGLIAVFRHNREHYAKITASLQPVLSMLTGGTLAKSFSPDPFDPDDERPIVTVERVVEGGDILYLGLDALPDSTVAGALGSIILADLTAYAGKRYNRGESGTDVKSVSLFVDETANVINGPMIELLNKGLEAGIRVTAAMQTVSDLAARLGSDSRARMALGNFNNLIALRSKDRLTQEFICETFGKTTVWSTSASLSSSADGSPVPDFRASVTRSIQGRRDEVVPPDVLGRLPNTEFFASVSGGRLYKGRIPILLSDDRPHPFKSLWNKMMKYMLTATALVLILMVMWLPARTPPEIFEETALREALMLRTGEGIPMPETAANLAVEYLDGLVWVSGVPDRYTLRPYGGSPMTKDEFAEIGMAAERTTQTEWLRAMKSLFVMATQRLAVMTAGTIALMPFILALIVDGFVRRRIREAEYHAPSPTWWTASLSLQLLAVCLGIVAIMHPNYPPQWLSVFPVAFALAARMTAATWHRFI